MTREQIELQFLSAQLTSVHAVTARTCDASALDVQLDRVIYEIDAVMNGYDLDTAKNVPSFMPDHLVKMRDILRKFHGSAL